MGSVLLLLHVYLPDIAVGWLLSRELRVGLLSGVVSVTSRLFHCCVIRSSTRYFQCSFSRDCGVLCLVPSNKSTQHASWCRSHHFEAGLFSATLCGRGEVASTIFLRFVVVLLLRPWFRPRRKSNGLKGHDNWNHWTGHLYPFFYCPY